ncbi:methyltransferase domain-containing protein [Acuticoccus sp. MNP-M23]|uniref:class I SAM-dependent DNA methyltransferase n=1 Tax=Acuticoccus sp. MNP-M23 TaxID=3072793 RepID=UPI002814C1F9|nr:methyltransferase domain-containing protein [Acuticoccus sp. MNP-M23]WMS44602.1 methyltransferase domain-containing protein [Acuticoccus sp. MNP-M23]
MSNDAAKSLDVVYAASSPKDVAERYDAWAKRYDVEMASLGYRHPTICLAMLTRHLPKGAGPVLDAGAGTGLLGEWMAIAGYDAAEALDISEGMLEVARSKGVYQACRYGVMGETLPFEDNHFGAVVSAGVFTTGHVGAEGFAELVRITRSGGVLVITVKDTLWDGDVGASIVAMAKDGIWDILEETPSYVSMPGRPDTVPSRAVVLKVR